MSDYNNGGPAFPCPDAGEAHFNDRSAYMGMTMRDYFAAKAMEGMLTRPGGIDPKQDAEFAYRMADAMLKARETNHD